MNTNVNISAPLGVLGYLGASFILVVLGLVAMHALVVRRFGRARVTLAMLGAVLVAYFSIVLVFSLVSSEKVLARGEEKYFCELDCHLAYSVVGVRREKRLGDATAEGKFLIVTVRTRFDEATTSASRGDALLYPNPRTVTIHDEQGRAYPVSEEGRRVLVLASVAGTPLETPLRPGESYTTELIFDLPADARAPVLGINESDLQTCFIIGHENSPLHKKTEFKL